MPMSIIMPKNPDNLFRLTQIPNGFPDSTHISLHRQRLSVNSNQPAHKPTSAIQYIYPNQLRTTGQNHETPHPLRTRKRKRPLGYQNTVSRRDRAANGFRCRKFGLFIHLRPGSARAYACRILPETSCSIPHRLQHGWLGRHGNQRHLARERTFSACPRYRY